MATDDGKWRQFLDVAGPIVPIRNFGAEFELYSSRIDRAGLAILFNNAGLRCVSGGRHEHEGDHGSWKVETDGSINAPGHNTFEVVSPILKGIDDMKQIQKALRICSKNGAKCNKSAGFHVHIGAKHFKRNLVKLKLICASFVKYEEALDLLVPSSRRSGNRYCKSNRFNPELGRLSNVDATQRIMACSSVEEVVGLVSPDRGYKMNLTNLLNTNDKITIEFRFHSSTKNWHKACYWILLLLLFVKKASSLDEVRSFYQGRDALFKFNSLLEFVTDSPEVRSYFRTRARELNPTLHFAD